MLQDLQKLDQQGSADTWIKAAKYPKPLLPSTAAFQTAVDAAIPSWHTGHSPNTLLPQTLSVPFQPYVEGNPRPPGSRCLFHEATRSRVQSGRCYYLSFNADRQISVSKSPLITHHIYAYPTILDGCLKINAKYQAVIHTKDLPVSWPFRIFTEKPLKTQRFSIWSHLQSIQVAHFASQETQASPFHSASITAAGFVEQHVRAALLASTETGVIRKLTWEPQKGSQLQRDA